MSRTASKSRTTKETDIAITLTVDGTGTVEVSTGIPFFDHLLSQLGRHGGFDLAIDATGLKVHGEGEWKVRVHGPDKRRVLQNDLLLLSTPPVVVDDPDLTPTAVASAFRKL